MNVPTWLRARPWALALAAAALLYFLGRWQGKASAADAAVITQAKAVLAASRPFHEQLAAQLGARRAAEDRAGVAALAQARAQAAAARSLALADSMRLARPVPTDSALATLPGWTQQLLTNLALENGALRRAIDSLEVSLARADVVVANLRSALAADSLALEGAQLRITTLETSLRQVVKLDECRILFVRCPSRTASFLVGAGLAVGAHYVFTAP